jgi:hypothetical protein
LLPGLLRCGHCGRRLHVSYSGVGGFVPRYSCRGATLNHGADRCISFGGLRVDEAVGREVLRVLTPGAIEAACRIAEAGVQEHVAVRQAVELELRQARYEAERARRQYDAVEPEHRLVAATLEWRWNAMLARVHELEDRITTLTAAAERQGAPNRAALLRLAEDFPRVWNAPSADVRTRKRIVRLLIEEIVVKILPGCREQIELTIHWKGGKHTQLVLPRNRIDGRPIEWSSTSCAISLVPKQTATSLAYSIGSATGRAPATPGRPCGCTVCDATTGSRRLIAPPIGEGC